MKVYFEVTGGGPREAGYYHHITGFVKPTGDGHGHFYGVDGKLIQFAWCDSIKAKCVDSSELPKDLWYSFRHGTHHFYQSAKKGTFHLENNDIDISSLEYEKVSPKQVAMYNKAKKAADSINSIEELKVFYPQIKGLRYIPGNFVMKVLNLAQQSPTPVINGELGIANFSTFLKYAAIINALGLK